MQATAEAFASSFVNATGTCENMLCQTDVEVLAEAITNVVAEASTSALAVGCAGAAPSPAATSSASRLPPPWPSAPCHTPQPYISILAAQLVIC